MKREELFNHTVDILVKAYQNGTLEHNNCYACAVGNLIAANCGYKFIKEESYNTIENIWKDVSYPSEWYDLIKRDKLSKEERLLGKNWIEKTGYSIYEIKKIEKAFEKTHSPMNIIDDEDGYEGLMNVVDVLMKIHECHEKEIETNTKEKFVLLEQCV